MATYVVGDIQGCYRGLRALLAKIDFHPSRDQLIAVGDLVARGEDSLGVIRLLRSFQGSFTTVLGNHDLHLLALLNGLGKAKKNDHLDLLLCSPATAELSDWLRQQPLAIRINEKILITHAGLYPRWSIAQAISLSHEIQTVLTSSDYFSLLINMYGNQPTAWQEHLHGYERYRMIINAFTRMRYVNQHAELDFSCKVAPADAPSTLQPWFSYPNKQLKADETVLFGHWASLAGHTNRPQYIALDTGFVWSGQLTAYCLETQERIYVSALDS